MTAFPPSFLILPLPYPMVDFIFWNHCIFFGNCPSLCFLWKLSFAHVGISIWALALIRHLTALCQRHAAGFLYFSSCLESCIFAHRPAGFLFIVSKFCLSALFIFYKQFLKKYVFLQFYFFHFCLCRLHNFLIGCVKNQNYASLNGQPVVLTIYWKPHYSNFLEFLLMTNEVSRVFAHSCLPSPRSDLPLCH